MITMNNLVNSFILNMTKVHRTESKYLRPLAKLDDTDKVLSDFPMAKLMNVVDTKKVHNDFEFTPLKIYYQTRYHKEHKWQTFIYY